VRIIRSWANTSVAADWPVDIDVESVITAVREAFDIQAPGLPRYRCV
jgi:hypothetical protein